MFLCLFLSVLFTAVNSRAYLDLFKGLRWKFTLYTVKFLKLHICDEELHTDRFDRIFTQSKFRKFSQEIMKNFLSKEYDWKLNPRVIKTLLFIIAAGFFCKNNSLGFSLLEVIVHKMSPSLKISWKITEKYDLKPSPFSH